MITASVLKELNEITCPHGVLNSIIHNVEKRGYVHGLNPLSNIPTKWSNTLKQFVGCCRPIV